MAARGAGIAGLVPYRLVDLPARALRRSRRVQRIAMLSPVLSKLLPARSAEPAGWQADNARASSATMGRRVRIRNSP